MVIDRAKGTIEHKMFKDIIDYFLQGTLIKVLQAIQNQRRIISQCFLSNLKNANIQPKAQPCQAKAGLIAYYEDSQGLPKAYTGTTCIPSVFISVQKSGYDLFTTPASSMAIGTLNARGAKAMAIL